MNPNELGASSSVDSGEINVKELLDQIVENVTNVNAAQWFNFFTNSNKSQQTNENSDLNSTMEQSNIFESIQQALNHIDFNLKRNSDFINELTKLLDTSRAIKQEAQLKKVLKLLEEEKNALTNNSTLITSSVSQPPSPSIRSASSSAKPEDEKKDDKKKLKSKSFKGFASLTSSPKTQPLPPLPPTDNKTNQLAPPGQNLQKPQSVKDLSTSLTNIEANFKQQLLLQNQHHEINNSDYIELEFEVEKISYHLDNLFRLWSKLYNLTQQPQTVENAYTEQLKSSIEFQTLINNLNSPVVVKELEQTLFKLNWLITSKSGFSEPNWQGSVISLTPSTIDSFIGVNLLKNYYKYVKYDFVSYKLFTRQLQLIQLCAIILNIIHRILVFYRENTGILNGPNESINSFNFSGN